MVDVIGLSIAVAIINP